MWPAATSTTIPSGSFRPSLTMVFKSEPSGFDVRTRPAARSKKYKRPTVFATDFTVSDLEALEEGMKSLFLSLFFSFIPRCFDGSALNQLDEGAETGNGLAENQVLHLERALVGVESFRIHEEPPDVVLSGDAVAAEQLASPRDRLAALGCREGFGQRCMRVGHLAFSVQLGHAHQEALRSGDVGEHPGQEILH